MDEELRELERRARGGDVQARARLAQARVRAGSKDDLLRDVLEAPDDDAPRLALAQLLATRDDPRAELIDAQVALATGSAYTSERPPLRKRVDELVRRHGAAWQREAGLEGTTVQFRRGFVEVVRAQATGFLPRAEQVLAREPVRRLALDGCTRAQVQALAAAPWTARLHALELSGDIGDAGAVALGASPHLTGLRQLNLGGCGLGPAGARALAGSGLRLERLALTANEVGDDGLTALAASPAVWGCKALFLARNEVGDAGVRALARSSGLEGLVELGLDGNDFSAAGIEALLEWDRPRLRHVELRNIGLRLAPGLEARVRRRWPRALGD